MFFVFLFLQLRASRQWLDLLPWSSPALERERNLHDAGKLAYDLGACDLVPLQLRLRLHGNAAAGVHEPGDSHSSAVGAMEVIREVLRSNPGAYRDGDRSRGGRGDGYGGGDESGGGGDEGGGMWAPEGTGTGRRQEVCSGASEVCVLLVSGSTWRKWGSFVRSFCFFLHVAFFVFVCLL